LRIDNLADLIEISRPTDAKSFDLGLKLGELSVLDRRSDFFQSQKSKFATFVDDVELGFRQEFEQFLLDEPVYCLLEVDKVRFLVSFDTAFYYGFSVEAGSTWVRLKIALGVTASLYGGIATYPSFEDGLARISDRVQTVVSQRVRQEYFMKIIKFDLQAEELRSEKPSMEYQEFWKELNKRQRDFQSLLDLGEQQEQIDNYVSCTWHPNNSDELRISVEDYLRTSKDNL
jgi:hypothetical protein